MALQQHLQVLSPFAPASRLLTSTPLRRSTVSQPRYGIDPEEAGCPTVV